MASPFNVFRKNQRIMMAVLIGLSMFAFIVADSINATNVPIFLGAILGAIGLWLLSNRGGTEGWLIAAVGGVVGAMIGAFAPGWLGRDMAVFTSEGNLTYREVDEISNEQEIANEFVNRAFSQVYENASEEERMELRQPSLFRFENVFDSASQGRNAALTYLFGKKADEMGISLTDKSVQDYLIQAMDGKLTRSQFREVQSQVRVGTGELFDILREQLRAREAYRLLAPVGAAGLGPATATPQQLWNDFKRLKTEAQVSVAALPVEAFLSEVPPPSSNDLQRFFDQYKAQGPSPDGTPGFRVPRQLRVAYLEIQPGKVREQVTPPTDEEILAHYRENKARYEFSHDMTGMGFPGEAGGNPEGETSGAVEAPRPGQADSESQVPESAGSDATGPTMEAPASDSPSETPTPSTEPAPEAENEDESSTSISRDGLTFVAFQAEAPKPAEAPKDNKPVESEKPATPESMDSEPTDSAPTPQPAMAASGTEPAAEAGAAEAGAPETDSFPSQAEAMPSSDANAPAASGEPSDQVREMIRAELMGQRMEAALDARQMEVRQQVDEIVHNAMMDVLLPTDPNNAEQEAAYKSARAEATKEVLSNLEALAKENDDLVYHFTPPMSAMDLMESEEYSIGQSMRWRQNAQALGQENEAIVDILFTSEPDQPMLPIDARSMMSQSRYVLVKAADMATRIPAFSDEGIEEKVKEAWTLIEARKLAEARAQELAKAVNESKDETLAVIAEGQKVVSGETGENLNIEQVGPFTWMQRSSVPSQGMSMPQIEPTILPNLPGAGEEFMRSVFETTEVGKAATSTSTDGDTVYVVQIESRTSDEELAEAREDFLKEDFFSDQMNFFTGEPMNPYRRETIQRAINLNQQWLDNFMTKYDVVQAGEPER